MKGGGGRLNKFIVDRMLGKLATWLRISGYDTLYVGDFNVEDEDKFLLEEHRDRVLLTRDKQLYEASVRSGRKAILITSDSVEEQLKQMKRLGVEIKIVMDRCSVCNSPLRKPSDEEALRVMRREGISEDLRKKYELWYCEKCDKLYWMGSHWRNMVKFLKRIEDDNAVSR